MPFHLVPENVAFVLTALTGAFVIVLWLSLIFWAFRDIRARSRDRMAIVLAVLLVVLFMLPGLLVYWMLRPTRTMEEEYQASLEEESLLSNLAGRVSCPGCSRTVEADWIVCPTCSTRLRKSCASCKRSLELTWVICPFCASPSGNLDSVPQK
jgi:RNA polymerase subunit RPABC4/transcription elongation factor Spt4